MEVYVTRGRRLKKLKKKYYFLTFTHLWCSKHYAKYAKRRLSKARRRAWKDPHERGLASIESDVNWRGW